MKVQVLLHFILAYDLPVCLLYSLLVSYAARFMGVTINVLKVCVGMGILEIYRTALCRRKFSIFLWIVIY